MATIRKRKIKWQVQVRRNGSPSLSRSFHIRKDAEAWARQMEILADRHDLPADPKALEQITLGNLVERYRDTVTVRKRGHKSETIILTAFLRHPICRRSLSDLRTADFAAYRDQRLRTIRPVSLGRQLNPIHNAFEVARDEWGLPIRENPLDKLPLKTTGGRRERRLRDGEWQRLIEGAKRSRNLYVVPIIVLAVETGMRRGEILSIRCEHIDLERRSLLIPHTKTGYARTIPLTPKALEIVESLRERAICISNVNTPLSVVLSGGQTTKGREATRDKTNDQAVLPITPNAFRLA